MFVEQRGGRRQWGRRAVVGARGGAGLHSPKDSGRGLDGLGTRSSGCCVKSGWEGYPVGAPRGVIQGAIPLGVCLLVTCGWTESGREHLGPCSETA